MHRSRLAGFIMDCRTDDLEQAAQFWSAALGVPLKPAAEEAEPAVSAADDGSDGLHIEVQKVEHESRVHLDIETDDIEAEVRRLEALGAKRVGTVHTWCVMQAPDRPAVLRRPPAARGTSKSTRTSGNSRRFPADSPT